MTKSEAVIGARGQIFWILALILSTSTIIYLERLDVGAPSASGSSREMDRSSSTLRASAAEALLLAEERYQAFPNDVHAAVGMILSLAVAVQAGSLDPAEGRARAEAPLIIVAGAGPEWQAVGLLADMTFGR